MKLNDRERLVRKTEKHIRHLVLNARDLSPSLAFFPRIRSGSNAGNSTWLALLRQSLAFTRIRRAGQSTSLSDRGWQRASGFHSSFALDLFPGRDMPVTSLLVLQWIPSQAPGVIGSALGLVGPESVYCDWLRYKVWSATCISVWQHVQLSEQIRTWDSPACCWDVCKQPPPPTTSQHGRR